MININIARKNVLKCIHRLILVWASNRNFSSAQAGIVPEKRKCEFAHLTIIIRVPMMFK